MRSLLHGPPLVLPSAFDALCRRWARFPPRIRFLLVLVLAGAVLLLAYLHARQAESRWGGPPITVWVAARDLGVGEVPDLRRVRLPPGAVPAAPATAAGIRTPLTIALPEGAVLTKRHVSSSGPAVGLPRGSRLVPVPVDEGWGVTAGGQVDVWIKDGDGSVLVAQQRPVIEVRSDDAGDVTALVSIAEEDVTALTGGLSDGSVLLSHAPG